MDILQQKRIVLLVLMLVVVSLACSLGSPTQSPTGDPSTAGMPPATVPRGSCGDGFCEGPENAINCAADCPSTAEPQPAAGTDVPGGRAPLFLTTMTHMEQGFTDDRDQAVFLHHLEQLTYGMDLADEYGAILTIESEQPFAIANVIWNRNFMAEVVARGHGVGTHCDFGFHDEMMSVERYSRFFAENKALVDALVGPESNLGCSGGGGVNDWARAATLSGFAYIDGVVGMHYLSMPLANRPDATWTDDYIVTTGFHINAPVDLYQRIYPFMVADATDFVPDTDGTLLVSAGELGPLYMQAEGAAETDGRCPDCPYGFDDVDTLVLLIREVDSNRDPGRVAKLSVYFPVADLSPENEAVLRYFFEQMQTLASEGVITWASQLQVYQAYLEWNP